MALNQSALLTLLDALRSSENGDLVCSLTERRHQELIEAEATAHIGAGPHERSETRTNQRNGHSGAHHPRPVPRHGQRVTPRVGVKNRSTTAFVIITVCRSPPAGGRRGNQTEERRLPGHHHPRRSALRDQEPLDHGPVGHWNRLTLTTAQPGDLRPGLSRFPLQARRTTVTRCRPLVWDGAAPADNADYITGPYAFEDDPIPRPAPRTRPSGSTASAAISAFAHRHGVAGVLLMWHDGNYPHARGPRRSSSTHAPDGCASPSPPGSADAACGSPTSSTTSPSCTSRRDAAPASGSGST